MPPGSPAALALLGPLTKRNSDLGMPASRESARGDGGRVGEDGSNDIGCDGGGDILASIRRVNLKAEIWFRRVLTQVCE